ncbi:unnamed protein product [Calypogeia fissa]
MEMKGSLFEGLPPPARPPPAAVSQPALKKSEVAPPRVPLPAIRGTSAASSKQPKEKADAADETRRVRFKTNELEATEEQILGAMGKIASHIGNPGKFAKASKLALQLLQAGNVKSDTADAFFEILRAAMTSPSQSVDSKLWPDYHSLFSAVADNLECFAPAQRAHIEVWEIWAILANDFRTDDTFVFSKASSRVRQCIDLLPEATEEDELVPEDVGGASMQSGSESSKERGANNSLLNLDSEREGKRDSIDNFEESDPFGLNALMPRLSKKEEKARRKKDEEAATLQAQKDAARLLNGRREALIACLKVAADQYKFQWAQTIIDILAKYAYDAVSKFTVSQRQEIEHLWGTIREQLVTRKYSKPSTGKLDVTPFERLSSQYAQEHISIRRAVGSSGERSAEQWLG